MNEEGMAMDAWIMAIPDNPYDPCPCGCGKKFRHAIKENPQEHQDRFIRNWIAEYKEVETHAQKAG